MVEEMDRNQDGVESSAKSPEICAFFALIDREAHRMQLLNEKKQNSEKPLMNNYRIWEPSFELEDFRITPSPSPISTDNFSRDVTKFGVEEKRVRIGIKRPRGLGYLSPLVVSKGKSFRNPTENGRVIDLNKEDEVYT